MAKKITKSINSNFTPTYFKGSSVPMYGLGSWLRKATSNIGNALSDYGVGVADTALGLVGAGDVIGSGSYNTDFFKTYSDIASNYVAPIAGQAAANLIAPGVGGQLLGNVQKGVNTAIGYDSTDEQPQVVRNLETPSLLNSLKSSNNYLPVMKCGGKLKGNGGLVLTYGSGGGLSRTENYGSSKKPYPSVKSSDFAGGNRSYPIPTKEDAIDALRLAGLHGRSDVRSKVFKKYPELKKENGGSLNNTTYYSAGGSHETNPNGGIPVGKDALVEEGEYRYDSPSRGAYIFSNRF